jgi:16S rRNA G966 N2-methylase RsmD
MKGKSFNSLWKAKNLEKVLRWNRKSHSTPYISELKRGIYFCFGLTKNTMYRPQMSKMICDRYKPEIVLDPCAGWGGRMLGAVASGAKYIAFEPNTKTFDGLNRLAKFLDIQDKVTLICDDALNMDNYDLPKVDLVLTSPPYFDLEIYTREDTQSITKHDNYQSWADNFLNPLISKCLSKLNSDGVSCWNVGKVGNKDMNDDVLKYHNNNGYDRTLEFNIVSSKRQAINKTKNEKSQDTTVVYSKT